jgi:feruloyl esterase
MHHRRLLVSSTLALFTSAAFCVAPAVATPCTNLSGLPLQHTTITSATDNDTGVFVTPTTPPTTLTGLPAFCRVTATLTPMSDSAIKIEVWLPKTNWNSRFLGTGGGGFQGLISYNALALGIQQGFATTNSDLGTGVSGCSPLYCGSAGHMGNPLAIAFGARHRRPPACSDIRNGSRTSATGRST